MSAPLRDCLISFSSGDGGGSNGKECSLTVSVDKPGYDRNLTLHFYVASNKLKILTLRL